MATTMPPEAVLDVAGLKRSDLRALPWEDPIWIFDTPTGSGVLKVKDGRTEPSLKWEMDLLRRLADRFPAPMPLDVFHGKPWMFVGRSAWLAHTYLPGETFGWDRPLSLDCLGRFLARYHKAVAELVLPPRPGAHGICRLLRVASPLDVEAVVGDVGEAQTFVALPGCYASGFTKMLILSLSMETSPSTTFLLITLLSAAQALSTSGWHSSHRVKRT